MRVCNTDDVVAPDQNQRRRGRACRTRIFLRCPFLRREFFRLIARAVRNPPREFASLGVHDAHHIHGRKAILHAHDSRSQQTGFALGHRALRARIHHHPAANVRCVRDPPPLPSHPPHRQKCGAHLLAREDAPRARPPILPFAITAAPPQFIAISAASSFVRIPPRPFSEGPAPSALSSGVISVTSGITSPLRRRPRLAPGRTAIRRHL